MGSPKGHSSKEAATFANALIKLARKLPQELYKSLTWDRGTEMAGHKHFTVATNMQVYFWLLHQILSRGAGTDAAAARHAGIDDIGFQKPRQNPKVGVSSSSCKCTVGMFIRPKFKNGKDMVPCGRVILRSGRSEGSA